MRTVILNLHGLGSPRPELPLEEHPYWISPAFLGETLERVRQYQDRVHTVFTADDGNLSDLEIAAPALNAAGISATFFVLTKRIGQAHYLDQKDIKTLLDMGHKIGSHGADHVDWSSMSSDTAQQEIAGAKAVLDQIVPTPVTAAAIPFGRYNGTVLKQLKAAGFTQAYSSDGGAVGGQRWPIPRSSLRADMTVQDIESILLGQEPLKTKLRRRLATAVKKRI